MTERGRTPTDQELEREFASLIALLRVALPEPLARDELRSPRAKRVRCSDRFRVRMSMPSHGCRTHN